MFGVSGALLDPVKDVFARSSSRVERFNIQGSSVGSATLTVRGHEVIIVDYGRERAVRVGRVSTGVRLNYAGGKDESLSWGGAGGCEEGDADKKNERCVERRSSAFGDRGARCRRLTARRLAAVV